MLREERNNEIKFVSLAYVTVFYMFIQYLAVPVSNVLLGIQALSYTQLVALIGISSFATGIYAYKKIFEASGQYGQQVEMAHLQTKFIFVLSACFLVLGMVVKIKSCGFSDGAINCDGFIGRILRPNYLYLASAICMHLGLLLSYKKVNSARQKNMLILSMVVFALLFSSGVIASGVGRSMTIGYFIAIMLSIFAIEPRARTAKFGVYACFTIIVMWVFISFFKSVVMDHQQASEVFGKNFLFDKLINRISHAHILDAVITKWPEGVYLYFYGWVDFFSLPSLGFNRFHLNGNDFGHAMGLIGEADFVTGVAPTFIGDLYIRGGLLWGVIIGMAVLGVVYRSFDLLLKRLPTEIALGIYALCFPILLHGTEDFVFLTLSTSLIILLFYLTVLIMAYQVFDKKDGRKINGQI